MQLIASSDFQYETGRMAKLLPEGNGEGLQETSLENLSLK